MKNRLIYIGVWVVLLGVFPRNTYAQITVNKTLQRADKHIKDAEVYYAEMNYNKAIESYQFAARLYRNNNLPAYYARCYNGIGNIYIDKSLYEKAKNKGFDHSLQQLAEIKSIDSEFNVDSNLVADAYEGLGRYYSSFSTRLKTKKGYVTTVHYDKALEYHQKALVIRTKLNGALSRKVALSYFFIGQCYRGFSADKTDENEGLNPIQKELEYLEKALEVQLEIIGKNDYQTANTYEALGDYFYEIQKDYHKGFEYQQKALKVREKRFDGNHPQIASSYIELAIYYRVMNLFDEELSHLEQALKIQLNVFGNEHVNVAQSYYLLANRYKRAGELEKALSYYQYVLEIFKKLKREETVEVAETYLAIGLCYREMNKAPLELAFLYKSEEIYKKVFGEKHFKLGSVHMEMGDYYLQRQLYDSTLYFYNKAAKIWKQQLGDKHYYVVDAYDKMANVYNLKQDKEQEFYFLMLALNLKQDKTYLYRRSNHSTFEEKDGSLSYNLNKSHKKNKTLGQQLYNSYINLMKFYKEDKDYELALTYNQQALAAVCNSVSSTSIDVYTNPTTEDLSHNIEWLYALEEKAGLFRVLYELNGQDKDLDFAIQTYYQAIEVINSLRTNFTSKHSRQQLTKRSMPIYEGAVSTLYALYTNTQNDKYLEKGFEIIEMSKSFVLLQALQSSLARGSSNIPTGLLEEEKKQRRSLAYYSNYKNRDVEGSQAFDKAYLNAKQSYDSLIKMLESNYTAYYDLKYKTAVTSIAEVQEALLDEGNLLLEYFVGQKYFYVFKLTKEKKEFFQVLIPKDYSKLIHSLRRELMNYEMISKHPELAYQSFITASHQVFEQFLEPFMKEVDPSINKITVIPDGMLNYIPFGVLLTEKPKMDQEIKPNYQELAFLVKKYQLNYNYSSTLLIKNLLQSEPINNGECIGFAPSTPLVLSPDSLPWTQKELEAIETIFNGKYYYGAKARKEAFKENSGTFSIIHLAMHGFVDMKNPMMSKLSFSSMLSDSSNKEVTELYAYEIHNLSLNADLVVLSACETGVGKSIRGEGVLSLARAFMYAGAPSVLTTLWEVNDFTSAALMETFYSNLSKGMSKPASLQQAKITFLSKTNEISGHPSYWGSFVIIGNPKPVRTPWGWWMWGLFFLGSTVLIAWLSRVYARSESKGNNAEMEKKEEAVLMPVNYNGLLMLIKKQMIAPLSEEDLLEQEDAYRRAIVDDDENPQCFYEYGLFQKDKLKAYTKASNSFLEALELSPSFDKAYFSLAFCQREIGMKEAAKANYLKACSLNPSSFQTTKNDAYFEL
jgi:CHAT domain-containing protein/tetratricopeptide (TPR) repeat protein